MPKLHFTVDSALLSELGEKLVESVHVALLELVKNAYDADASKTIVRMIPQDKGYEIHVTDNGIGMTLKQVEGYWMRIATTNKAIEDTSPKYGRKKSGSKGIGRFSCRRLGTKLSLKTTAQLNDGRYETTSFKIDWGQYTPGTDVTKVTCEGRTTHSSDGETGTELIIAGGKSDEWSRRGWGVLKRRLILLVSNRGGKRKGFMHDPGFNVSLLAPDFEESTVVDPREQLMDAGWGRLDMTVDKYGIVEYTLLAKRIGQKKLTLPDKYKELAGITADIAILPERKDQFRDQKEIALSGLREKLDEWGGIRIRVDGIQIPPYGESQNDWLNIDRDRGLRKGASEYTPIKRLAEKLHGVTEGRELLNMLSSKSYLGEVKISEPSDLFELKASREGFVGEHGVDMLRMVIRHGIDWVTVYRDYYLRQEEEDALKKSREEFENVLKERIRPEALVEDAVNYVQKEIRQIATHLPTDERRRVVQNISKATSAVLHSDQLHRKELKHLRLVASTSSLLLVFSHEVRSLLSVLDKFKMDLMSLTPNLSPATQKQVGEMIESFDFTKSRFNDLLEMTSLLSIDSHEATEERLALAPRIEKAAACFSLITKKYDIKIDLADIPNSLRVGPLLEAELYSILLNAISNAIKSVIASGEKKIIAVTAEKVATGVRLHIMDTGLGVSEQWRDLFTPFVADPDGKLYGMLKRRLNPEDKHVVGTGSGLGLSVISEIIEARNGTIKFVTPTGQWTCSLEIVLP